MNKVFNIINNHSIPLFLGFKPRGPITLIQSAISQPRAQFEKPWIQSLLFDSIGKYKSNSTIVYRNDLIINRSIKYNWHFPNYFGYFMVIKETA